MPGRREIERKKERKRETETETEGAKDRNGEELKALQAFSLLLESSSC